MKKKKILVVDNDVSTVKTFQAALSIEANYVIDIAYSGEECLKKMKSIHQDLLILDVMMPKISGIDVCRLMTKDKKLKKIPVLLVSALPLSSRTFRDSIEKFQELSVVKDILEKPFPISDLIKKCEEILGDSKR